LGLYAIYLTQDVEPVRKMLENYIKEWQYVQAVTTGNDLRSTKLEPGPVYSQILAELKDAWLDKKVTTPQQEKQLLANIIHSIMKEK